MKSLPRVRKMSATSTLGRVIVASFSFWIVLTFPVPESATFLAGSPPLEDVGAKGASKQSWLPAPRARATTESFECLFRSPADVWPSCAAYVVRDIGGTMCPS
jgi:hypothetical protein